MCVGVSLACLSCSIDLYFCSCASTILSFFFLINLFILFIYFWLHWVFVAAQAFSSCGERGLLFFAVRGLLIAAASLVAEHGL